jgi:predicted transposase YbfD/YdcC
MPAPSSSPIPAAAQPAPAALAPHQCRSLLCGLGQLPDPRQRRGRRHPLAGVLGVAVAAVLAGARSLAAIGEWAADAPGPILAALGVRRDPLTGAWRPPAEATVRRVLARVDPDALDRAISAWLAGQQPPSPASRPPPRRAVAVDGKTLRGSGHHKNAPVHLLAAMDHTSGAVLAQTDVEAATNEITQFQPLLQRLDLTATIITADALHTQRVHAEWLVTHKHADYLLMVKANQPALHRQLKALPWREVPVADHTHNRGHGRVETRRLQVTTVAGLGLAFPHATQAARQPPLANRDRLRHHQPHRRPSPPRPAGRLDPRPLGHRGAAPHPRHYLRRGRLPAPHRHRAPRHGQPAQPRHRHPARPRRSQHRRRPSPQRP